MEESAFLRMIAAAPDDDAPRLIYADWLDERGDPRGGFIRAQCALARLPADDPRRPDLEALETHLLESHAQHWTHHIAGHAERFGFRRGFVEDVTLPAAALRAHGRELAAQGCLTTLRVSDVGTDLDRLLADDVLRHVRSLDLFQNRVCDSGAAALAACPHLTQLEELSLSFNGLSNAGVKALLGRTWPKLRFLDLRGCDLLSVRGATHLARTNALPALETLDVSDNQIDSNGLWALTHTTMLPKLTELRAAGNPLGDAGARSLAESPLMGRQMMASGRLDLSRTQLGSAGVQALVGDPLLRGVRSLNLAGNHIESAGLIALTLTDLPHLRELDLSNNLIGDEGVFALEPSPLFSRLVRLNLSYNLLSLLGVGVLAHSTRRDWRGLMEFAGNDAPAEDPDQPLPIFEE